MKYEEDAWAGSFIRQKLRENYFSLISSRLCIAIDFLQYITFISPTNLARLHANEGDSFLCLLIS
jgi:hypothetical protein